jgi:hypothetical protein
MESGQKIQIQVGLLAPGQRIERVSLLSWALRVGLISREVEVLRFWNLMASEYS